jgi:hypothetical protein
VIKALYVSWKMIFWKSLSKLARVCLPLEKLVNEKHFLVKEKFGLVFRKVFFFYFELKILSRSCEKFKNILLFVGYIKFDHQSFNYYIFCFEFFLYIYFFSISSLKILFSYQFWSFFYCYLFFSYHFLNWIFCIY